MSDNPLVQFARLRRKLAQRDKRIAGMQSRIATLESRLATKDVEAQRATRDVTKAVQDALCNVRLIPILGMRGSRIVEVQTKQEPHPAKPAEQEGKA